ncbi:hypothetical protein N5D61_15210 [Pseudomonas sp. GD03842]|uniref:hypothetical protein n=1 Tax=Pseudomonas sp. GD03842 TaxID=2975385 RepID=UPI00244C4343|nr:hypothetical protein [Pseudomonas sp. GD03842]MDH0747687.1 hypothetical protein [Pseudomonas sp. GD03842]
MTRFTHTLFPPLQRDYSTLALRSLLISGLVTPVQGGDGGVNIVTVDSPLGLLVAVDPWLRMASGDHIDLYWDDTLVGGQDVGDQEVDQRLLFFIASERVVPGWAEKVYYRLTRQGSTTSEDSVALRIRVKLDAPGGVDKDPHLPGHSELAAPRLPQDVIDNGVDAEWAARGVPAEIAAYPGRAARDTIELQWGDAFLRHTVTDAEAAGSGPITMTVDQATILAGGDSPNLLVHYQVFDEVWNFSSDWSLRTFIGVEAGAQRLDAPIIKEAFNEVIDLGQLGDDDVTIQIEVRGPPFELNDRVTMTWIGTPRTGAPRTYEATVTLSNIPSVTEVKVPNAEIRALLEGRGQASYVLNKANGSPPQSSKRAFASITGKIPLPAPDVFEAVGNTLDPGLDRAHAVIPVYERMANGDLINLIWLGVTQNGTPLLYEAQHSVTANEVGAVIYIPVVGQYIGPLVNGTLDVSYRVSNDALAPQDVRVSSHTSLVVAQRLAELPAPSVDEAEDDVLDPESVPHNATLRVPYTGTAVGDILTWYWQGESPDGSASDWVPITSLVAGKPLTFNIPRSLIEPNINNLVKLYYSLKLSSTGRYQYSKVLELTIGKLIGLLPAPTVLEAAGDDTLDPMQAQSGATVHVSYESMDPQDVITLVWLGTPGTGSPPEQSKSGNAGREVEFAIPAAVIGANIGHSVQISYRVKRYLTEKKSELRLLTIKPIADSQLPSPDITQADKPTKVLNLATFSGDATTTLGKWPFIALGQRVWLHLAGETESGGPQTIKLLDGKEITSGQVSAGLSETVPRTALEQLGQDTPLDVVCKVAFSETAIEDTALPFPITEYVFKRHHDWVTPVIVSVKDAKGEVANGGTTFDTTLDLSGTGTIDTELEILDGTGRLTTTRTTLSGSWAVKLTTLRPKTYSVTARALDGSGMVSQPRTWEVFANLTPTIEKVVDSRGPVSNGGTTVDTTVTLSGKASPDQRIELFDGTSSQGTATADSIGSWSRPVTGLAVREHPFKARALYGTGPESTVWRLTVAAAVTPTISSIKGTAGTEIPADGFTTDTSVTLTGAASANQQVEIFDGTTTRGKATANAAGVWTLPITGLTLTSHAMKAKALYGNGAESAVRRFTVVAVVNPTITSVLDPKNTPVANGGSTYASSVTASGQASIRQVVEVFDGATSKGTATASATGAWTRAVSGLAPGNHSLTAKALYASKPVSSAWTFQVKAAVVPTITSVRDSKGEVSNNGSTTATTVTASGKAAPSEHVEVFDGAASKGTASVSAAGDWTHTVSTLALGAHSLKATAKYADQPSSNVRTFTVVSPIPDFVLDTSPVSLSGRVYILGGHPNLDPSPWPSGTTSTRTPRSGVAPYGYTSSNTNVARVDSNGTVYSRGNGIAMITVRDSQGRSGSYTVNVSGVTVVTGFGNDTYPNANNAVARGGKRLPSHDEQNQIATAYLGRWPMGGGLYWSTTPGNGLNTVRCKDMVAGGWADLRTTSAWGIGWSYANIIGI